MTMPLIVFAFEKNKYIFHFTKPINMSQAPVITPIKKVNKKKKKVPTTPADSRAAEEAAAAVRRSKRWKRFLNATKGKHSRAITYGTQHNNSRVVRTDNPIYLDDIVQQAHANILKHLDRLVRSNSEVTRLTKKLIADCSKTSPLLSTSNTVVELNKKLNSSDKSSRNVKSDITRVLEDTKHVFNVNLMQAIKEAGTYPRLHFPNDQPLVISRAAYENSVRKAQETDHTQ
jgi:hypothetical protein